MARFFGLLVVGLSSVALNACVKDNKIEDYLPPTRGAGQPGKDGGAVLTAADACSQLVTALASSRDSLHCQQPTDATLTCPGYLAVAGALSCDSVTENSVTACLERIKAYGSCADFSAAPCVVTVVRDSCNAPPPPAEAGSDAASNEAGAPNHAAPSDAKVSAPDAAEPASDGSVTDAASTDGGDAAPADAHSSD